MAGGDYKNCDHCGKRTFYDAELQYEEASEEYPAFREAGVDQTHNALLRLGDWAVLCQECSKTHKTQIVPIEGAK